MTITTFIIVLVAMLAGLAGIFWFVQSGKWVWLKEHIAPPKTLYVNYLKFCEDRVIRTGKYKVGRFCLLDDKNRKAWYLLHKLFIPGPDKKDYLVINDRDDVPVDFFNLLTESEKADVADSDDVAGEAAMDAQITIERETARNVMAISLSIIALLGAVIFVGMAAYNYWQTGSIM